jgi:predicted ribosomally synthesized peptide with nif11-like leader
MSSAGGPRGVGIAMRFIGAARRDPALRERLAARASQDLAAVVAVAGEAGFSISAEDVRAAFALDWGLRRARYLRDE